METCCKSKEIYTDFDCHSFSYSAASNFCQLMEEKTTAKMQENVFYNFYLREPLVKDGQIEQVTTCAEQRYKVSASFDVSKFQENIALRTRCTKILKLRLVFQAFEFHWQNPGTEDGPLIPECDESGQFAKKQCQTVWDDKRQVSSSCSYQQGSYGTTRTLTHS